MKTLIIGVWVGLSSLLALGAHANQVSAKGRTYSPNQCAYYSTSVSDISISYYNEDLKWGSRVVMHYGFRDDWKKTSWQRIEEVELTAAGPFLWSVDLKAVPVDARGSYFYSNIEFVFRVVNPDGTTYYDNGRMAQMGFYSAVIPRSPSGAVECEPGLMIDVQVRRLASDQDYKLTPSTSKSPLLVRNY